MNKLYKSESNMNLLPNEVLTSFNPISTQSFICFPSYFALFLPKFIYNMYININIISISIISVIKLLLTLVLVAFMNSCFFSAVFNICTLADHKNTYLLILSYTFNLILETFINELLNGMV